MLFSLFRLDYGKIYVPVHSTFKLKCQNKTEGTFASLFWLTNAYNRNFKKMAYSYDNNKKQSINPNFYKRISRFDETSIKIVNAQLEDSGNWECNIIFQYKPKTSRVRVMAVYDVVVVSKYFFLLQRHVIATS